MWSDQYSGQQQVHMGGCPGLPFLDCTVHIGFDRSLITEVCRNPTNTHSWESSRPHTLRLRLYLQRPKAEKSRGKAGEETEKQNDSHSWHLRSLRKASRNTPYQSISNSPTPWGKKKCRKGKNTHTFTELCNISCARAQTLDQSRNTWPNTGEPHSFENCNVNEKTDCFVRFTEEASLFYLVYL